jgi:hypothetical protein
MFSDNHQGGVSATDMKQLDLDDESTPDMSFTRVRHKEQAQRTALVMSRS